jgi:SAM-dependent methyltransferase
MSSLRITTRTNKKDNMNGQEFSILQAGASDEECSQLSRRQVLAQSAVAAAATLAIPASMAQAASMEEDESKQRSVSFGASWTSIDGLNQMNDPNPNNKVVGFDMNAYKAMRDDKTRTPFFEQAIQQRLGKNPESQIVLDLGTGPFCLFAMIAAQLGAGKVYALEANPEAAASARAVVDKAGYGDIITVVEGFSTEINLPEPVDFCVAEIAGSIASEEGAIATIRDAHRFLKDPTSSKNWIPNRIQTYGAPASYTLHNLFGPPEFDWTKLNGEPVRFSCRDYGLELLADPQLVEDISFASLTAEKTAKRVVVKEQSLTFTISADRMKQNTKPLFDEFRQRSDQASSEKYAQETSHSFSGIAMWPRIYLSDDNLIVDSRSYPMGGHQKSHWQTVLPIVSERPIGMLQGGEIIRATYKCELPVDVTKPPQYSIQGVLESKA